MQSKQQQEESKKLFGYRIPHSLCGLFSARNSFALRFEAPFFSFFIICFASPRNPFQINGSALQMSILFYRFKVYFCRLKAKKRQRKTSGVANSIDSTKFKTGSACRGLNAILSTSPPAFGPLAHSFRSSLLLLFTGSSIRNN